MSIEEWLNIYDEGSDTVRGAWCGKKDKRHKTKDDLQLPEESGHV